MSLAYRAVGWNRQKRFYDCVIGGLLLVALAVYAVTIFLLEPATTPETFVIRFTSIAALALLHIILAIGPMARLDPRFLPLLYNRRHLGVSMFLLALIHGVFAIVQFHALGNRNPLVSVLTSYRHDYLSVLSNPRHLAHFPFEALGLAALCILFVMAATSHDFWLKNLGASFWKTLHMLVYVAYGLVLAHVFLGALQSERSVVFPIVLGFGFAGVAGLHLAAFAKERKVDRMRSAAIRDGFVFAARSADMAPDSGKVAVVNGERIALFLREGKIFALSNVCRHQGGPLGEGRIVNGCLTCPWHGYQYRVEDGCSPPPFTEVVPTYVVRVISGHIYISPTPLPLGTKSEGAAVDGKFTIPSKEHQPEFYIGWKAGSPAGLGKHSRRVVGALLVGVVFVFFLVARFQNPVDSGRFEFGIERTFEGVLYETPLPLLQVSASNASAGANFLLVGLGKFGPPEVIRGKNGQKVRFNGSLIHRNGVAMIEMNRPESFKVVANKERPLSAVEVATKEPLPVSLGKGTFIGELVDTKCFFGVMRPATGKVHRGCAIRCLSGGAPPGLLVRDAEDNGVVVVLVGAEGKKLDLDIELAARTLEIRGDLELHNGIPILRTEQWRLAEFGSEK